MGSSVSRPTGRTSFSVISAKASAALRWRSTLSEKESVVNAESGEPVKKLVVVRSFETSKVRDKDVICVVEGSTHFRGTEEGQPLPPAHSLIAGVHTIESCGIGLTVPRDRCEEERFDRYTHSKIRSKRRGCPLVKKKREYIRGRWREKN
jgi:hypothetical protein